MQDKVYMAIDLKSFYASVECVERGLDPLKTNLVVADSSRSEKTICLAVTPSLKAYGISSRARLFEVIQKVKEIKAKTGKEIKYITASPRMALYIQYSARIYQIYLKYFSSEDIHVYSVDEVFIDASAYLKLYRMDPESLCRCVIKDILAETGITATAGIAGNLFLCKVAMDIVAKHKKADENGVRLAVLDEISFRKELWNHKPLTDFWKIGPGTEKRLAKIGIYTLGDLALTSLSKRGQEKLYKIFGIDAEILIDHAWGYEPCSMKDIKSYKSRNTSLSSGQVLQRPYSFEEARLIVKEMTELLVLEMAEKKLLASSFSLYVGYENLGRPEKFFKQGSNLTTPESDQKNFQCGLDFYGRLVPLPSGGSVNIGKASNLISKIMDAMVGLYDRITNPAIPIRRINICANNVISQSQVQFNLFEDNENDFKEENLQDAVIDIQKRYGKNSMLKGHNFEEAGMTIERNKQIGGHKA
ncbi:MAG: DNA methylase [Treponemataceae bacterium]|nr:DNA methylase [Treponemataceae bacterium]